MNDKETRAMKEEKKQYSLYINFENYMKLSETAVVDGEALFGVGEYSVVGSQKYGSQRVIVYSIFELTKQEYEAAKEVMHQFAERLGYGVSAVNRICEEIVSHLDVWVMMMKAKREQREMRAYQANMRALRRLQSMINNL